MDSPKRIVRILSMKVSQLCVLCSMMTLIFFLLGCRLASNIPSLVKKADFAAQEPTIFASPIFRDDFSGQLNSAWTWENEDTSRYTVTQDGWLAITGGKESIFSGGRQTNLLWIDLPKGDFEISIHLESQPLFDFQRAGLLLHQDADHYVLLSQGYCLQCVLGGSGVFLEFSLNGHSGRYTTTSAASDLYLMLIIEYGAISAFYAIEPGQWQHIASLENDFRFERAALSVTNNTTWSNGYDLIGKFDYLEIRRPTQIEPAPTPSSHEQG